MTDWFAKATEMQRELWRAQQSHMETVERLMRLQQSQFDSAQKIFDANKQMNEMRKAGERAAQANLDAWKSWAKFWGWE
ncbi:MAG: hypothetical protein CMN73_04680 [Sphingomonas sp.]|nr:hypothetical protein [Sphingomonas sp.]|tara:strand:- start:637 stop:873 length:237 start_codon:yes stop_codon:yes gene_type:complete